MKVTACKPFIGQHCETTATGTILNHLGIELSEPMLFGIGEGLGFIFWKMKTMRFPFIGGRIKTDVLTRNIARNLQLELLVHETSSSPKAWNEVKALLDNGVVVGLKLDCYHLEYFSRPIHFAGHYVAIYGYDSEHAFLVDTAQQGSCVQTSLENLAKARAEKGPMSSRNLYYTLHNTGNPVDMKSVVLHAVRSNALDYLNAPIANLGYKGILKTSSELVKWFDSSSTVEADFAACATMMEKAGTGGALFRNLYRDFLKEGSELLDNDVLCKAHAQFTEIAAHWTQFADLLLKVSATLDKSYVNDASELLKLLASKEQLAMGLLAGV